MVSFGLSRSAARTARRLRPPSATGRVPSRASSGPRMRKSMRAAALLSRRDLRYRAVTALSPRCKRPGAPWPPMSTTATTEESVMGQVIPRQHPAVVLKSHYKALRALLAVALVAIAALAAVVVILASDDNNTQSAVQPAAKAAVAKQQLPAGTRFDGGPNEGTRGITSNVAPAPGTRFDGGPDEGTRGPQSQPTPNEGFKERAGGLQMIPMGPSN